MNNTYTYTLPEDIITCHRPANFEEFRYREYAIAAMVNGTHTERMSDEVLRAKFAESRHRIESGNGCIWRAISRWILSTIKNFNTRIAVRKMMEIDVVFIEIENIDKIKTHIIINDDCCEVIPAGTEIVTNADICQLFRTAAKFAKIEIDEALKELVIE